MDKVNKIPQIIVRIIFIICIFLGIIIILSFITNKNRMPGVFKYKPVIVETDTSISNLKKGDLIIIKDIDTNEYKKDDVVVFRGKKSKNVLSKIENVDNNEFILSRNIKVGKDVLQGIKILRIPLLGSLIMVLQSIVGIMVLIGLLLISIVWYKSKTKLNKEVSN